MSETEAFVMSLITRNGACPPIAMCRRSTFWIPVTVDSMGVMQLVVAIEEHFDIELSDAEIMADDFRTIRRPLRHD